ncbi:MAG: type II toxin-antitoxin system HicA family toxin [Candidatus Sungbacteria bacterium]|nr:type II toxin-antitoxin system HicA family toxin [Candidatus Sungbacteria bacterium]
MPRLKTLSGEEVIKIFLSFGFEMTSQRGSHVKLRRILPNSSRQTLTIANHPELDRGTLHAIYRQGSRYIPDSELNPHFYSG